MIENRKAYRLPFKAKFLFGNASRVSAGNTTNLSSGGVFVQTMEPFSRATQCRCVFSVDSDHAPLVANGVVKRVIASSTNVDEIPGMGIEFVSLEQGSLNQLENFMLECRKNFEIASTLLSQGEPDLDSLEPLLSRMHLPQSSDLGELRFYVERILKSMELIDKSLARES
jgi:hypothetical protein